MGKIWLFMYCLSTGEGGRERGWWGAHPRRSRYLTVLRGEGGTLRTSISPLPSLIWGKLRGPSVVEGLGDGGFLSLAQLGPYSS